MREIKRKKRDKPYPGFPLFLHATGQWAKKIRGRMRYFGVDPEAALQNYLAKRDDLQAGREPRVHAEELTIREGCNWFLTNRKALRDSNDLSARTFAQYFEACETVLDRLGEERAVADLRPADFDRLRAHLAKTNGPVSLSGKIQHIRTLFKFLFDNNHITAPVKMGTAMKRPTAARIRQARHESGPRMLEAEPLRKIIKNASEQVKAMILLGLNCGFGASDVAALPRTSLDLKRGWVNFPRPKTHIDRRCPLWPETTAAIAKALESRPDAKAAADRDLVFITRCGQRWVRITPRGGEGKITVCDAIGGEFKRLLKAARCDRPKLGFYLLRHTFRTVADGSKDQPACDSLMGHVPDNSDMAAKYREKIDDGRLRAVVNVVRSWLWPKRRAKTQLLRSQLE